MKSRFLIAMCPVVASLMIAQSLPAAAAAPALPWEAATPLRELAKSEYIHTTLQPFTPQAGVGNNAALLLNNPDIKASLWGAPNRITISILKSDVFDRRYATHPVVTLAQVREGAFSPANRGFDDMPAGQRRPVRGYLLPAGGRHDPYACWNAYPFPCQKPVGQIIIGLDDEAGALRDTPPPALAQSCASGEVRFQVAPARADFSVLLSMTRNVFAIRGTLADVSRAWLRLHRHQDQSHLSYMDESGAFLKKPPNPGQPPYDYEKDKAWNVPVAAPESGSDGRFFWIRQTLPAEKTFPRGFTYYLVGVIAPDASASEKITLANNEKNLGTPPSSRDRSVDARYALTRAAPGSAATAAITPSKQGAFTAYVTVVTEAETADPLAEARRRLDTAVADGYEKLLAENVAWYAAFYDQRENGRVFYGDGKNADTPAVSEDFATLFQSWNTKHGGGCKPDMRKFQAGASYAYPDVDSQLWKSLPCYNELFYTPVFARNRADSVDMWWKLVEHWLPASRVNARETYGMPGMALLHGYLPPVRADSYVHTNLALEYCLDTPAQVLKVLWDEWDYGGDKAFLRDKVYPALRDYAVFCAAYAKEGADGRLHIIPSMEAEAWGIFPEFSRSRDAIGALCMFKWTFLRAAAAADALGVDAAQAREWRALAGKIAAYPEYDTGTEEFGRVFTTIPGIKPGWKQGDHPWFTGVYPTTLADEITLDSPAAEQDEMVRTARFAPARPNAEVMVLLGACPDAVASVSPGEPGPLRANDVELLRREVDAHPERLLNSRSGRIHVFPCVPAKSEIAFRRFQARGGFLISATRAREGAGVVEIEARRDEVCHVANPWPAAGAAAIRVVDAGTGKEIAVTWEDAGNFAFPAKTGGVYRIVSRQIVSQQMRIHNLKN